MRLTEKKVYIGLAVLATLFFLFQRYVFAGWDFIVYTLNAKYLFGNGFYFEIGRPPLISFMIGVFAILFGFTLAQYLYIAIVSAGFATATYYLAKKLKMNSLLFYIISLNPFLFKYGLFDGTELLSVTLIELVILLILHKKSVSGLAAGLLALSRYNAIPFAVLGLFLKKYKKIFSFYALFMVPWVFWLAYNHIAYGNMITSVADQYALNVVYRGYMIMPVSLMHFIIAGNILLPFALYGLWMRVKKRKKADYMFLIALLLPIYSYTTTPFKTERYLFLMLPALFYFSYFGVHALLKAINIKGTTKILALVSAGIIIIMAAGLADRISSHAYYRNINGQILEDIHNFGISDCAFSSNDPPTLNDLGIKAFPAPLQMHYPQMLKEGYPFVFYLPSSEPVYANNESFFDNSTVLKRKKNYVILKNSSMECPKPEHFDRPYLENLNSVFETVHNYSISTNPCYTMFMNHRILEKACNYFNGNGFVLSEPRRIE